jgi:hypothetical protein
MGTESAYACLQTPPLRLSTRNGRNDDEQVYIAVLLGRAVPRCVHGAFRAGSLMMITRVFFLGQQHVTNEFQRTHLRSSPTPLAGL